LPVEVLLAHGQFAVRVDLLKAMAHLKKRNNVSGDHYCGHGVDPEKKNIQWVVQREVF
jgi:hypothetical protein